jgi:hypothetical protein
MSPTDSMRILIFGFLRNDFVDHIACLDKEIQISIIIKFQENNITEI